MGVRTCSLALGLVLFALLPGCRDSDDRRQLERMLSDTSVSICNGECSTHRVVAADCARHGKRFEGRTYRECRVRYEGLSTETICVAPVGDTVKARDPKDCS